MPIKLKRIIITVVVIIILIIVLLTTWPYLKTIRNSPKASIVPVEQQFEQNSGQDSVAGGSVSSQEEIAKTINSSLQVFSRSFVERYGSFSTHSDYENLEDLYSFMTASFKSETERDVSSERLRNSDGSNDYYGITTKVISVKDSSESGNQGSITISTQREESGGSLTESNVYYQDIKLSLIKINDKWKVNKAEWQ